MFLGRAFAAVALFVYVSAPNPMSKMVIRLVNIGNCTDLEKPLTRNYVTNVQVLQVDRDTFIVNSDMVINDVFDDKELKTRITAFKCEDRDARRCEKFLIMNFPNFCRGIAKKGQVWSPYFKYVEPPFICPLDKKYYRFRNSTLDLKAATKLLKTFPAGADFYWRIDITVLHKNKPISCVSSTTKLDKIKARGGSGSR